MSTIFDIADLAGVSKSTVSAVLNDNPKFSATTRRRVMAAADRLGYRPNPLSRALAGGKSMSIGVVLGSLDPLMIASVQAIEAQARSSGYQPLIVSATGDVADCVVPAVRDLVLRRIDGLIAYSYAPFLPEVQRELDAAIAPIVYIRSAPPGAKHVVRIEREQAVRRLAAHLRDLGHRRVVDLRWPIAPERRPAGLHVTYDRGFAQQGIELISGGRWLIQRRPDESHSAAVYRLVREALADGEGPTAINIADDELAIAVMAAVADSGLRVPQDISVAGKDGHHVGELVRPSLTTISEPQTQPSAEAFTLLQALMTQQLHPAAPPCFEAQLVVRQSTGPACDVLRSTSSKGG